MAKGQGKNLFLLCLQNWWLSLTKDQAYRDDRDAIWSTRAFQILLPILYVWPHAAIHYIYAINLALHSYLTHLITCDFMVKEAKYLLKITSSLLKTFMALLAKICIGTDDTLYKSRLE